MAVNSNILVTVYNFSTNGNLFKNTALQGIPLPASFVVAQSPDSRVFCYSKIIFEQPRGMIQEAYTAETVSQLVTKSNA